VRIALEKVDIFDAEIAADIIFGDVDAVWKTAAFKEEFAVWETDGGAAKYPAPAYFIDDEIEDAA
jgi:hypothetical protein